MAKPPLSRAPDNPWPQWPKVYKLDYGQEEALGIFGDDPRTYQIMTKEFVGDENGRLQAVRTIQIAWRSNGHGRPRLEELPGTEKEWPAQLVLLAMGFLGPQQGTAGPVWRGAGRAVECVGGIRPFYDQCRRVCSPPEMRGAARASSSGRSTKGAARRGRSTAISWAKPICHRHPGCLCCLLTACSGGNRPFFCGRVSIRRTDIDHGRGLYYAVG